MATFIQRQNLIREDYKIKPKSSPIATFFRSRSTKGLICVSAFSFVVPLLIYYFVIHKAVEQSPDDHSCSIKNGYKVPCGKEDTVTLQYCSSINCCFDNATKLCFHFLPSKYYYFQGDNQNVYKPSQEKTPFGRALASDVTLSVNEINANSLQIILHKTSVNVSSNTAEVANYNYTISKNPLYVEVFRQTGELLLTTAKGPTIVSDYYWEWSFQLTEEYLFGLGQLLIDLDENSTLTKVIYPNNQDHSSLPIFMASKNGRFHGVIVRHEGPLEVTVLPSNLVILKSLAGSQIVLEVNVGDTPADVRAHQLGQSFDPIEMWTLGVHICREGFFTMKEILTEYQESVESMQSINLQYDSDCINDNLVLSWMNEEEEFNPLELQRILQGLQKQFILSLSPQVLVDSDFYKKTLTQNVDVYYTDENGTYVGRFLEKSVTYPYFGHSSISNYTKLLVDSIEALLGDKSFLSNLIFGQNWPTDDSFKMTESSEFQYLSQNFLDAMSNTLPWDVQSEDEFQLLQHNKYGALQVNEIRKQLQDLEGFVMTASNNLERFYPRIIQNVDTSWTNFKTAISQTLFSSIFHHPLSSVPVCGSTSNYNLTVHESLCIRWYIMASTMPIFRISSDLPRRDPSALNTDFATKVALNAINLRYILQFYYHTVLNRGEPLTRPMFYDFPQDEETFALDEQYMVGDSILVAHPTLPDKTSISIYLPRSVETWYEIWGGTPYNGGWINLGVVESDWIGFIPQGKIVPLIEVVENEKYLSLIVALKCNDSVCTASGGVASLTFNATSTEILFRGGSTDSFILDAVTLHNVEEKSIVTSCIRIVLDSDTSVDITQQYDNCPEPTSPSTTTISDPTTTPTTIED